MKETCTLSKEDVKRIQDRVEQQFFKEKGADEQRIAAAMLLVQEVILAYRKAFGEQCQLEMTSAKRRKDYDIVLRFAGDEYNPCTDEGAPGLLHLLKYGQDIPQWSYADGWNVVEIIVPRTSSTLGVLQFCLGYARDDKPKLYGAFAVQLVGTAFNIAASFLVDIIWLPVGKLIQSKKA